MKSKGWRRAKIKLRHPREAIALKLVGDGALSIPGVADGRIIPVLIVDTSNREDAEEYVRIHQEGGQGDVTTQWGKGWYGNKRYLHVKSLRPVEITMLIELDVEKNAALINLILKAEAFYFQPGRIGDRLGNSVNSPKILIGAPDTGFRERWQKDYLQRITKKFKKQGLSRSDAKSAALNHIKQMSLLEDWVPPRH